MPDPIDSYCDQFQVNIGPYGATLNFVLTAPTLPPPGQVPQSERVASVRMSLEHLKVMTYILSRNLTTYERQTKVEVQLPVEVLNALSIGIEDWEHFWRRL